MDRLEDVAYNDRLFSGGLRSLLHHARFHWIRHALRALGAPQQSVLELGCYDGKLIEHLPIPPERYLGLDANWEGGLDIALRKWAGRQGYEFRSCSNPDEMKLENETFDCVVAMETLEHIPTELVDPYLQQLAAATRQYFIATVPNEIGLVFALKYLTKRIAGGDYGAYTLNEFINETLGNTQKVQRNEHKGFDYRVLRTQIERYFDVIEYSGHPFRHLPKFLNFGIGIIAKPKLRVLNQT